MSDSWRRSDTALGRPSSIKSPLIAKEAPGGVPLILVPQTGSSYVRVRHTLRHPTSTCKVKTHDCFEIGDASTERYVEKDVHWISPFPLDVLFFLAAALEADFCARGGKRCP